MTRYTIGGVAFAVAEPLPGLATDGFADIELSISFIDDEPATDGQSIRRVSGADAMVGWIDAATSECWLPNMHNDPADRAWQLRQMAPIFSSLVGHLVLHAGAVASDVGVTGFIGESGVGKSTLVRHLSDGAYRSAADDLMAVRFNPSPMSPLGRSLRPVASLLFLGRAPVNRATLEPLGEIEALELLVRNGFGEHGDAKAWGFQFDAYHRLTTSIPHFRLTIPDDLGALADVHRVFAAMSDLAR